MDERKKPEPAETSDLKPIPEPEVEYLSGPETAAPEPPAAPAAPGEGPGPAKGKGRKKESDARVHRDLRELKKDIERLQAALESECAARQSEASEFKDKYLRALAEMENLRKRLDREKAEFFQYALSELLKEILPTIDNFERALKAGETGEGRGFREGVELIFKQLGDLIRRQGVVPIESVGRDFDPTLHQAVSTEEREDVTEPTVGEELQKGYLIRDRLLRPAMVKVFLPKKS
jgi:molecular chaperone GrpE